MRNRTLLRMAVAAVLAGVIGLGAWGGWKIWKHSHSGGPVDAEQAKIKLPELASPRLVIRKAERRLFVYDGQQLIKVYRAAFGPGQGDKVREGDKRTPEGEFYVCTRNPNSRFTLALGLSYPNAEDAARGLRDGLIAQAEHDEIVRAIASRTPPPWNTALGGEIMIHGAGSGRDWTLGCIALDDDDIRELYPRIPLRTAVTILP